jgi:hypothetical protein
MRTLTHLALVAALFVVSGCMIDRPRFQAESHVEQSLPHHVGSGVKAETKNGKIIVRADEQTGSGVTVIADIRAGGHSQEEADRRLSETELHLDRLDDETLHVYVDWPQPRRNNDRASLEIIVPDVTGVRARTSNGAVTVTGASGFADLHTSNGVVTLSDHKGEARIETSNGKVFCTNISGDCRAHTSNGAMELREMHGEVDASTSNGAVVLVLAPGADGAFTVTSSNGAIRANLPAEWAGSVDTITSNGSIQIHGDDLNLRKHDKRHMTVSRGDSDSRSTLRTSNGGIVLEIGGE